MNALVPFKARLNRGDVLIGTWIKTPSYVVAEVLGDTALDVLCLDAEHAPFDRQSLDSCILACRAKDKPVLVRVPCGDPHHSLNALDVGATGILVPHVTSGLMAEAAFKAAHYGAGGRGYAGSPRAAGYTRRPMAEQIALAGAETTVIAQIEDVEGVENIGDIAAVGGIDCLFIGRADLAVSMGATRLDAPEVIAAAERVCEACRTTGMRVGMFVPNPLEIRHWREKGVTLFLLESDHTFLLRGAASLVRSARAATAEAGQGLDGSIPHSA